MPGRFRLLFVAFFALLCACKHNEVRQIPVSDFFKTPEKSFFKISPDGKFVSYLKPYKDKQNIYIKSLADRCRTNGYRLYRLLGSRLLVDV
jgi:hypothetical protein